MENGVDGTFKPSSKICVTWDLGPRPLPAPQGLSLSTVALAQEDMSIGGITEAQREVRCPKPHSTMEGRPGQLLCLCPSNPPIHEGPPRELAVPRKQGLDAHWHHVRALGHNSAPIIHGAPADGTLVGRRKLWGQ